MDWMTKGIANIRKFINKHLKGKYICEMQVCRINPSSPQEESKLTCKKQVLNSFRFVMIKKYKRYY